MLAKSTEHLVDCAVLFARLRGWPVTEATHIELVRHTVYEPVRHSPGVIPLAESRTIGLSSFVTHSGVEFQAGYNRQSDTLIISIA